MTLSLNLQGSAALSAAASRKFFSAIENGHHIRVFDGLKGQHEF